LSLLAVGPAHQRQRPAWASRHAQPTTDAAIGVQRNAAILGSKSLHLTSIQTGPAPLARFGLKLGYEWAGDSFGRLRMVLEPSQNAAATAATAAEEGDVPGIARLEYQVGCVRSGEDLHQL